jgi:HK97 family phage prohead protease
MNVHGLHEVQIEEDGRILRAIALPYNEEAYVIGPGRRGERVAHRERFDPESIADIGSMYGRPILLSHDESRPVGRILSTRSTAAGLEVEGELLGADVELESIRKRAAGGILSHMSVGFLPNRGLDIWEKPDASGLPLVRRRGAVIREVSIVLWPAYDNARITGIHARTAAAVARHEASERAIAETLAVSDEVAQYLASRRRA